jgi:hypothetical protein
MESGGFVAEVFTGKNGHCAQPILSIVVTTYHAIWVCKLPNRQSSPTPIIMQFAAPRLGHHFLRDLHILK